VQIDGRASSTTMAQGGEYPILVAFGIHVRGVHAIEPGDSRACRVGLRTRKSMRSRARTPCLRLCDLADVLEFDGNSGAYAPPNFQTGMPSFLALSARFAEMPEPGKTMTPIGNTSRI
jgi:hypothetical protein